MESIEDLEFNPTPEAIQRAKKTLLFLLQNDREIQMAVKKTFKEYGKRVTGQILTKEDALTRIKQLVRPVLHRKVYNAYPIHEVYNCFPEYTRDTIKQCLIDNFILEREITKKYLPTGTNKRFFILNLYG